MNININKNTNKNTSKNTNKNTNNIIKRIIMMSLLTTCIIVFAGCNKANTNNSNAKSSQAESSKTETSQTETNQSETSQSETEQGDASRDKSPVPKAGDKSPVPKVGTMQLDYATQFSVDYYEGGYASIHIEDGNSYVLVPDGAEELILDDENATFIHMPCDDIYLAASSAMDLFHELGGLNNIRCCSTKADDYVDSEVKQAIDTGKIKYVGKYSAPDYEMLLTSKIDIAIESTMIYHSPKIKEELSSFGIPVLVERSSYESDPLGRLEWIKLYGLLFGKSDLAKEIFDEQVAHVNSVIDELNEAEKNNEPKVAFFYISSNGYINVRKPGDYVSKMIEIAGGKYAFDSLKVEEENALSTVNISWEDFYYYGKDADILIYNGTIDGGISSIDELVKQNEIFNEFNAIKNKRVYCLGNDLYQESSKTGEMIEELSVVIKNEDRELKYIKYLK